MCDHNQKLRDALYPEIECAEEPMRADLTQNNYAVWRKLGERSLFASGKAIRRITRFKIEAYLLDSENAQGMAELLIDKLKAAGFESVRESSRVWESLINRRVVHLMCSLREDV